MGGLSNEIFFKSAPDKLPNLINYHGFNLTLKGCNIPQSWCRGLIAPERVKNETHIIT